MRSFAGILVDWLGQPSRRLFFCAWAGGLVFFVPALQWMRVGDPTMYLAWLVVAVYCSLYLPVTVLAVRVLEKRGHVPLLLSVPVLWCALEFLRAYLGTGFAWYFLAHTQHALLPVIQISDVTGAYGVSFLVAAVNAVVFEVLAAQPWFCRWFCLTPSPHHRRSLVVMVSLVLAIVGADLAYGAWRLTQDSQKSGPRVALLQGNLSQDVKDHGTKEEILRHYFHLLKRAARQDPKPDLIVWPETGFPYWWNEESLDPSRGTPEAIENAAIDDKSRRNPLLFEIAYDCGAPMLVGANAVVIESERERDRVYNSALLLRPVRQALVEGYALNSRESGRQAQYLRKGELLPANADAVVLPSPAWQFSDGRLIPDDRGRSVQTQGPEISFEPFPGLNLVRDDGRYDKIHRVPLGEYVPFKEWMPWLQKLTPYEEEYGVLPGEEFTRFSFADAGGRSYRFGVLICFEDSVPSLAREYANPKEEPVDFLINISNDGWFKGTEEHEEHLAICRFRAVECRRSVARSVNMGISAVIDGNGRVVPVEAVDEDRNSAEWQGPSDDTAFRSMPESQWGRYKCVSGVLTARVPIDSRSSLYVRWGDWFAWSCWALLGTAVMWTMIRSRA
jgi:apolipoprotein N-acyltransferase